MSADPGRRARYLEALGIDVWVRRDRPHLAGAAGAATVAPVPAALPAAGASRVATPAPAAADIPPPVVAPAPPAPGAAAASPAQAASASDWEALQAEVSICTRCALHAGRTQAVFASGDRAARWMVVGEAPGEEEDRRGEPFVGRAGQLLDAMLAAIELPRPTVFVANMVKCRPPRNRDPRPEELAACRPYLERQVALLRPALILVVGRIAAQNLLGTDAPLARLRGEVHRVGGLNTPVIVTYHPAYLLRTPADKRKAWEDLKLARRVFGELAAPAAR